MSAFADFCTEGSPHANPPAGVELPPIEITLKVGRIWLFGKSRYIVVRHVYGEKPTYKYVGPALRHVWKVTKKGRTFCTRCSLPQSVVKGERYCRRQQGDSK